MKINNTLKSLQEQKNWIIFRKYNMENKKTLFLVVNRHVPLDVNLDSYSWMNCRLIGFPNYRLFWIVPTRRPNLLTKTDIRRILASGGRDRREWSALQLRVHCGQFWMIIMMLGGNMKSHFDCLLSRQHLCQKLSQSKCVCKNYSKL